MKRAFSYTAVFVTGVVACALALKTLGDTASLLPGADAHSKQAVLTVLNTVPPVMHGADDNPIATAAAKLEPSVVTIHTFGAAPAQPTQQQAPSPFDNPFFRQFFGAPPDVPQDNGGQGGGSAPAEEGAASGVIISPDGYVLTNNHVVKGATKITVNVGEKGYDAHVVGADPVTDIAVVKINTNGAQLPVANLGNSDNIHVGDWAIAVGNPLDVGTTVTLGIISAVSRTGLQAEGQPLQSVIQTDAAINPGNSGGALADINGRVIGINEAIESPTGYYSGIGFAIPINSARRIAAELIENGKVVHPYLGIAYAPLSQVTPQQREHEGIAVQGDNGVVVQGVSVHSPASQAGLEVGDVILRVNGQPLSNAEDLNQVILNHKVGDVLVLTVNRDGQDQTVNITLRARPATYGIQSVAPSENQGQDQQPGGQAPQGMPFP